MVAKGTGGVVTSVCGERLAATGLVSMEGSDTEGGIEDKRVFEGTSVLKVVLGIIPGTALLDVVSCTGKAYGKVVFTKGGNWLGDVLL